MLVSRDILPMLSYVVRQWTQVAPEEACMYPPSMPGLTTWERDTCPWWLDMEKGHILARERDLREAMLRDVTTHVEPGPATAEKRQPGTITLSFGKSHIEL